MEVTQHAIERAKKRFRWKPKTLDRMAEKALQEGIKHCDTKSHLKKYISRKWDLYKSCNNTRIHGEVIFFFHNNRLITLYSTVKNLNVMSYMK
jgi:hypothetical protein